MAKMLYHFEQKLGFMNDPNGCVYFQNRYHMFFQYNENGKNVWWGHAVSDDLLHWEELPVALKNDECLGELSCWSGSSIIKDDTLYLFYTAIGKNGAARTSKISVAFTKDGVNFEKYENNPIISTSPLGQIVHFRDPKVFAYNGKYYMLIATEQDKVGKILCYTSFDLLHWEYSHEFYSSENHYGEGPHSATLECPDFFSLGDKWVLKFSSQKYRTDVLVLGSFNGKDFIPETTENGVEIYFDAGKELFAMQSFANMKNKTVLAGWMWNWEKPRQGEYAIRTGTMCIPREFFLKNGKVYNFPVETARNLLKKESKYLKIDGTKVTVYGLEGTVVLEKDMRYYNGLKKIETVDILQDGDAIEIFFNGGETSITQWLI